MRKQLTGLAVFVACLVAADTLLWAAATRMLSSTADRWAAVAVSHGWTVAGGRASLCPCESTGWPFAASILVPNASLAGGERFVPGGVSWTSGPLLLSVSLFHPFTLMIEPEGQQIVRVSHAPSIAFTAGTITASVPLGTGTPIEADLHAGAIEGGIAGSRHPQDVRLDRLWLHLTETQGGRSGVAGQLEIAAQGIGLPDSGRWPLGGFVSRAGARVAITSPPMPFWDTLPGFGGGNAQAQAEAWRDGGGRLAVRDVDLHWGPLVLHGTADLQLDGRLQPAGTGTADVAGTGAALDALADAGLLSAGLATTASAVLAVMPHVSVEATAGPVAAVRLPFVLRDSTLSVGQIPLVQLDEVAWRRRSPI